MKQPPQLAVDESIAVQAAEWFFRMQEDDVSAAEHQAWQTWLHSNPLHDQAWQRAQQVSQRLGLLPQGLSTATLKRSRQLDQQQTGRRQAIKTLAMMLALGTASWQGWRSEPAQLWLAQYSTRRGERKQIQLADGSVLHLNTASGIDTVFDAALRRIMLKTGEILVQTAKDARPLQVATRHGLLQPLGTRFIVRDHDDSTDLAVLEGAVEITTAGGQRQVIEAGWQTRFDSRAIASVSALQPHADGWIKGMMHARDMRLADFAAELARYRNGILRCGAEVADLRISGAYQLDHSEQVLNSLPMVLPVKIEYFTRYWVSIAAA